MTGQSKNKTYVAACYARLSVDDKEDGVSASIETQRKIIEDYCKDHGIVIYGFYCDDGYTGTNFKRPDFQRMIADIKKRVINTVIVKDLSRFARDVSMSKYIEELFPRLDVRFIAIGESFDSLERDASTDLGFQLTSFVNQIYPADCSKKVRIALKAKAKRGEYTGAFAPYGFEKVPGCHERLRPDPITAPIVQRIFELIANEGYGYTRIARTFRKEQILTPMAYRAQKTEQPFPDDPYRWNLTTVSAIVHNQMYLGHLVSGKRVKLSYKYDTVRREDPENWIVVEGAFPALVSQELWDCAHRKITARKRETKDGGYNIFAGLLKCDKCGRALGFSGSTCRNPYFRCETYKKNGPIDCTAHYVSFAALYEAVLKDLRQTVDAMREIDHPDDETAQALFDAANNSADLERRLAENENQQNRIQARFERMYQDRLDGIITPDQFRQLSQKDEEHKEVLQKEYAALVERLNEYQRRRQSFGEFLAKVKEIGTITKLDAHTLHTFIDKIVVGEHVAQNQEITIYYKFAAHSSEMIDT